MVFISFLPFDTRPAKACQQEQQPEKKQEQQSESQAAVKERVAELLDLLEEQNKGPDQFKDAWMLTLKELVDAGPDAVPQLIEELDKTDNDMMLRCTGFCLRAIGDKRAVPALIRAIPRTLREAGSDMGFELKDEALADFMGKHDLNEKSNRDFTFGRPVREVIGALREISGQAFDDEQLFHIFMSGTSRQRQMKEKLFHAHAQKWAQWWEANAAKQVNDKAFHLVNLKALEPLPETKLAKGKLQHYRIEGGGSGWILESCLSEKPSRVFLDLDTSRVASLPEKWKNATNLSAKLREIEAWASEEGFDLMGSEYLSPTTGKSHYALRPIGLEAWELGRHRWKMDSPDITFEALISESKSVKDWLLHRNHEEEKFDPDEPATFLFRTKDGTPGLLFVGVEVLDDSQKPGGIMLADEDLELSPIAFKKGRRFGFKFFEEIDTK